MHHLVRSCLPALLWLAAVLYLTPAHAQVRRCMKPDGDIVYTDRRCVELGAVERAAGHDNTGSSRVYRGGCSRTLQDLLFEMTLAIDARDVNRLASVYHWAGMSSGAARAAMNRLDKLVQQPLIAVEPVMSTPPESLSPYAAGGLHGMSPTRPAATDDFRPRPVGVRIEQVQGDSATPSHTRFDLHEHFGCLWIRG